jgi:hypothetical protein
MNDMSEKPPFGGRPPSEPLKVEELKKLGRKRIIEMAVEAAQDTGSTMIPKDFKDVKVLVGMDDVVVELARGMRAYSDRGERRIESLTVQVRFNDSGPCTSYEGKDLMTDEDKRVLEFVLKKMPPNYTYISLTIIDKTKENPDAYTVELSDKHTMGRHTVDKKTGEWTYVTHKHYARGHADEDRGYVDMKD